MVFNGTVGNIAGLPQFPSINELLVMQQKAPKENQSDDSQDIVEQYKTFSTVRKTRSDKEKKACKKRDGQKCMVTETAHPHACHIVPFAFNSSEANT